MHALRSLLSLRSRSRRVRPHSAEEVVSGAARRAVPQTAPLAAAHPLQLPPPRIALRIVQRLPRRAQPWWRTLRVFSCSRATLRSQSGP